MKKRGIVGSELTWAVLFAALALEPGAFAMGKKKPEEPLPAPDFKIAEISLAGTGCPGGAGTIDVSPDQQEIRIRFDQLRALAGGSDGKALDRKNCSVAITFEELPKNLRIRVVDVALRGEFAAPSGSLVKLAHETFATSGSSEKFEAQWGETEEGGEIRMDRPTHVFVGCGETGILRTNTSVLARKSPTAGMAEATLTELDLSLRLEPCGIE